MRNTLTYALVDSVRCFKVNSQRTLDFWHDKHRTPNDSYKSVWWEASVAAVQKLHTGHRRWHVKFASGHCGVGTRMRKRGEQDHANCPRCSHTEEDVIHVLRCPAPTAAARWHHQMVQMDSTLTHLRTSPELHRTIMTILEQWRTRQPIQYTPFPIKYGIREAVRAQSERLGWTNFLHGRWSPEWEVPQQQYYQAIRSRRTSKGWASAVIKKLFLTAWDMWDHRNQILHDPKGPEATRRHATANAAIVVECQTGFAMLLPNDRRKYTRIPASEMQTWTLVSKEQWLEDVRLARIAAAAIVPDNPANASIQRQQQLMTLFFTHPGVT